MSALINPDNAIKHRGSKNCELKCRGVACNAPIMPPYKYIIGVNVECDAEIAFK
jgi:hypothetical protein